MYDTRITIRADSEFCSGIDSLVKHGAYKNRTEVVKTALDSFIEKNSGKIQDYFVKHPFSPGYPLDVANADFKLRKTYGMEIPETPPMSVLRRGNYCGSNGKLVTEEEKIQEICYPAFMSLVESEEKIRKKEKRIIPPTPGWEEIYRDPDGVWASNGILHTGCSDFSQEV